MSAKYPIILQDGKPFSINLTECPEKPKTADVEEVMSALSTAYGRRLGAIKSGRYWLVGDMENGWRPIFGHRPGEQTAKFDLVLARGLEIGVSRVIPL